MSTSFVETDCEIEFNGQKYSANGACVTENRIVCYAKAPADRPITKDWTPLSGWTFTDWHGNQIGTGAVTSTWRVGPHGTKMYAFIVRLPDGRRFNCRGQGEGMIATGRLAK